MKRTALDRESSLNLNHFVLTFSDEFDGDSLDETKWFTDPYFRDDHTKQHIINDEKQAYVPDALEVTGGFLRIKIEKHQATYAGQSMEYTSGLISTRKGGFGQRYGYFEIRCKMPKARGLWPAFWLMPREGNHPGSPGSEIDIMEFWSHKEQEQYSVNIHWDGYDNEHKDDLQYVWIRDPDESFHLYGAELTPTDVVFYLDRREVARYGGPGVSHDFMHLIANCAVVEAGADDDALPDVFEIDYIRVYKRVHPVALSRTLPSISLARTSHRPSAATADLTPPALLRFVDRPRRITENTSSTGLGRRPCRQYHLCHFATKAGEKTGLGASSGALAGASSPSQTLSRTSSGASSAEDVSVGVVE